MSADKFNQLLEDLSACQAACNHCFAACLKEDDVKMMVHCIKLNRECADICAYLEKAIQQESMFVAEIANLCSKICEACGEECEKHETQHCQLCAKSCFKCADSCKNAAYAY